VAAEELAEFRTSISRVNFVNPRGRHGGRGSTLAHNEVLSIIDTSLTHEQFLRRL